MGDFLSRCVPFPEHVGFDDDGRIQKTIDPPTAEEIDQDLGFDESRVDDKMEAKKNALSTFLQWLTAIRIPEIMCQKMIASAVCVNPGYLGEKTVAAVCERYRISSTGEFSKHVKAFKMFITKERGADFEAVFDWVFSIKDKDCIEQKTLVFVAMIRPALLSVSTIPGMAKMLNNHKQGIHHHVKSFRRTFHSHRFERGGTVRQSQSVAARASWARRKAQGQAQQ